MLGDVFYRKLQTAIDSQVSPRSGSFAAVVEGISTSVMKSTALIALTVVIHQHLGAAIQMQTVTLDAAEIIASGSLSGDMDETIEVFFPEIELVFNQFDPAIGTLNNVTFDLNYTYSISITTSSFTSSVSGFETSSSVGSTIAITVNGIAILGTGGVDGYTSRSPDEVVELTAALSASSTIVGGQLDAMALEGAGTALYRITPAGNNFRVSGYFADYSVQRDADLSMTVTYNYTPVPEPQSFGFIVGFLAVCWVGVRRKGRIFARG